MSLNAEHDHDTLLKHQKKLLEAITFLNKSLNETSVEWLQLNGFHQNLQNKEDKPVACSSSDAGPDIAITIANMKEDVTTINIQPIDLGVVSETQHFKFNYEEFDSD